PHNDAVSNLGKSLLAGICVAAALAVVTRLSSEQEPRYKGRSLTQWLRTPPLPRFHEEFGISPQCSEAICSMGTNAIRAALRWISYEPSGVRRRVRPFRRWIPDKVWPPIFARDDRGAIDAEHVFFILGPRARPAIPELTRLAITAKTEARVGRCVRALVAIGPEALPALATMADNPNTKDRTYVIEQATALEEPAVPLLLKSLSDADQDVAAYAATGLGFMHVSNSIVIPALTEKLQSTNAHIRGAADAALARFGPEARDAILALLQTLSDPDADVRAQTALTLHAIQPQTFTNLPPGMTTW
ncbi:MAG TPA: HEAT repeat domain-containing protein, partial [Patescibacteria group bacterium]|nr:HEAT repeat domain-containing protein [Patescibacteria group bacterium]